MLNKEQMDWLATFADKGIAEDKATEERNVQVLLDVEVQAARDAKQAELQAQAQALIDQGMQDFEAKVVPTITVPDQAVVSEVSNAA